MLVTMFSLLTVFTFYALVASFAISIADPQSNVHWWCDQTPYPDSCKYYVGPISNTFSTEESHVHQVAVRVAMDHALRARTDTAALGSLCRGAKEHATWSDCLELYEATIRQLNRTLNSSANHSDSDSLAWLSAALTNLDTCATGFAELGISGSIYFPMLTNVSQLISNSLALNKFMMHEETRSHGRGLPSWVTASDRKLLQARARDVKADLVVAQDGSGDFRTIKEAVDAASKRSGGKRFVIYVKAGVYKEYVQVGNEPKNLMLVGDGIGKTIITGSRSVGDGSTTFKSATFAVTGEGFIARGITFRNTAGPAKHQAVALRSGADLSVFYKCSFEGYQDTLYAHSLRQFYRECDIYGTVDFIFGNAAVVFQNCNIHVRRPMSKQKNTVTAQGRTDPNQSTGISIQGSRVTAASDLKPVQSSFQTFLGRPWKEYSRTVFLQTYLDGLIAPAGWLEWSGDFALKTLFYGEYRNTGPGSDTSKRVKWGGYHDVTSSSVALQFTVDEFISGDTWLPSTDVPYTSGL